MKRVSAMLLRMRSDRGVFVELHVEGGEARLKFLDADGMGYTTPPFELDDMFSIAENIAANIDYAKKKKGG